jgi:hypothetical protein
MSVDIVKGEDTDNTSNDDSMISKNLRMIILSVIGGIVAVYVLLVFFNWWIYPQFCRHIFISSGDEEDVESKVRIKSMVSGGGISLT